MHRLKICELSSFVSTDPVGKRRSISGHDIPQASNRFTNATGTPSRRQSTRSAVCAGSSKRRACFDVQMNMSTGRAVRPNPPGTLASRIGYNPMRHIVHAATRSSHHGCDSVSSNRYLHPRHTPLTSSPTAGDMFAPPNVHRKTAFWRPSESGRSTRRSVTFHKRVSRIRQVGRGSLCWSLTAKDGG